MPKNHQYQQHQLVDIIKPVIINGIIYIRNERQHLIPIQMKKNFVLLFSAQRKWVGNIQLYYLKKEPHTQKIIISFFFSLFFLLCARQGKTCLCQQFLQEKFLIEHKETVDEMHSVELSLVDRRIILEILDTAGIDEFPVMRRIAISHGDAFLILYAVNDAHSFEIARQMYELVREIKADAIHTIPLVIVANKCDIELDKYEITREYADMIVRQQWQIPLVETTCHQRESVLNTFRVLLQLANITTTFGSDVTRRSSDPSLVSNRGHRSTSKRQSCTQQ